MTMTTKYYFWMFMVMAFTLTACQQPGGSSSNAGKSKAASTSLSGYDVTDYGNGWKKAVKLDNNGKVTEEGDLNGNDQKIGTWLTYHPRKELLQSMTTYKDGVKNGAYIKADDRGSISEKAYYNNGELDGQRLLYNRTRIKERAFYKMGKLEGERKVFYENTDKIQEESNFKNGQRDGISKWYNQDGDITIQYEYKDGKKVREVPIDNSANEKKDEK